MRTLTERRWSRRIERLRLRLLRIVLLLGLLVLFWEYLRFAGTHDQIDFGVYRSGGHAILTGRDLYALRVPPVGLPFTYPPAAALCFAPLTLIPIHPGQVIWTAASLLGLCVFVLLTIRRYAAGSVATSTSALLGVLILVVCSDPVRVNLNLGQINVVIGLLIVADLCGALPFIPRGVMTGVAAALKLTPLFLLAYFVAVRRYRAASVAVCTFASFTALAFLVAPRTSTAFWLHGYFADARRTGGIAYISNQSINGVIVRLTGSASKAPAFWLPAVIVVGAVLLWAVRRLHDRRPWLAEPIALAAMLLLSPVSWVHHWILVLPLLAVCFRLRARERRSWVLLLPTCTLSAVLWFGVVWHVPNTHDREYHHNVWQFLVGNSDVLLLSAVLVVVLLAFARDRDASAETNMA